ncbi:glycosyltransferase [Paenibacillus sp. J5C_2022]|uniref:glycosyltransferase family 2 protein n=1 Tax=Paenibacillus sp. J5C2022 TaxID=2977129 RepID=UPI0021D0C97C|nr:glycosyltransferase [Paenibacillus sp. J5C2022]MCU6709206.1 glycosyltransferase [Paenibacillus sp. J5C2022]
MLTNPLSPSGTISVIIPTLNAGEELSELLERLWRGTVRPKEIIVIDSESEDGTPSRAERAGAHVLPIKRAEFDHGGARNKAAAVATGDILMFMTQDAMPCDNEVIERLIQPLLVAAQPDELPSPGRVVMSYARQLPQADADILERLAREHNYPPQSSVKSLDQLDEYGLRTFFCSNVCSAIRRDIFQMMGGFQEPVLFNEDMFMAARCVLTGYAIAYCGDAKVVHSHNYSVRQQFNRYFDNGASMRLNAWITSYSSVGGAGSSLVRFQLKGLAASGKLYLLPRLIVESAAKLLGYKLGFHHRKLPRFLARRISMHKLIWHRIEERNDVNADSAM